MSPKQAEDVGVEMNRARLYLEAANGFEVARDWTAFEDMARKAAGSLQSAIAIVNAAMDAE